MEEKPHKPAGPVWGHLENPNGIGDFHVRDEVLLRDIRGEAETPDEYWEHGWLLRLGESHRADYELIDRYISKAFPTRYRIADFTFGKSLRRVISKNRDLKRVIRPLRVTPAKESLFLEHSFHRFKKAPDNSLSKRYEYIVHHPASLMEICFFDGETLVAFSIFEVGEYSIMSNCAAWKAGHEKRCLGTLTLLTEVEYARSLGLKYFYLGHIARVNPACEYKKRFPGLELYDWENDRWVDFTDPRADEMIDLCLPEWHWKLTPKQELEVKQAIEEWEQSQKPKA